MKVLCIIPAHNEEASLPELLAEIKQTGYDVLVINDASTDRTAAIANAAEAKCISLPVNLGIGGGVQAGFIYALRNNYDVVVQVDGDGQHNPALIHELLEPLEYGVADCVIGSRYLPTEPDANYQTPFARRMGMHFSTWTLRIGTGLTIYDTTSGFRALNRKAFTYFATEYPVDHPEAEALLLLHLRGFRIMEIPTKMRSRVSGQSLFTLARAILYPFRVFVGFCGILLRSKGRI